MSGIEIKSELARNVGRKRNRTATNWKAVIDTVLSAEEVICELNINAIGQVVFVVVDQEVLSLSSNSIREGVIVISTVTIDIKISDGMNWAQIIRPAVKVVSSTNQIERWIVRSAIRQAGGSVNARATIEIETNVVTVQVAGGYLQQFRHCKAVVIRECWLLVQD